MPNMSGNLNINCDHKNVSMHTTLFNQIKFYELAKKWFLIPQNVEYKETLSQLCSTNVIASEVSIL
jgi:hypothetical protein